VFCYNYVYSSIWLKPFYYSVWPFHCIIILMLGVCGSRCFCTAKQIQAVCGVHFFSDEAMHTTIHTPVYPHRWDLYYLLSLHQHTNIHLLKLELSKFKGDDLTTWTAVHKYSIEIQYYINELNYASGVLLEGPAANCIERLSVLLKIIMIMPLSFSK